MEVKDKTQEPRKLLRLKSTPRPEDVATGSVEPADRQSSESCNSSQENLTHSSSDQVSHDDAHVTKVTPEIDKPKSADNPSFLRLMRNRRESRQTTPNTQNHHSAPRTAQHAPREMAGPEASYTSRPATHTPSTAQGTRPSTPSFLNRIRTQRTPHTANTNTESYRQPRSSYDTSRTQRHGYSTPPHQQSRTPYNSQSRTSYNPQSRTPYNPSQPRTPYNAQSAAPTPHSYNNASTDNHGPPRGYTTPGSGPSRPYHSTQPYKNKSVSNHEYRKITQYTRPKKRVQHVHIPRIVDISESNSVSNIALQTALKPNALISKLKKLGTVVKADSTLDRETAQFIIEELGHTAKYAPRFETELKALESKKETLKPRCPIVTIAGHVDHGKTTILDAIRKSKITETEYGGITQSIGAYQVEHNGKQITFLDTPGHLAFSKMREHGIRVTDIALLIVAADDSVQEQTIESIRHMQAANTPIIVVINKIDAPNANPQKVLIDLVQHGIIDESMGGDVMSVQISAKTGQNLDKLLDTILIQAELMELRAVHEGESRGVILEASTVKGIGACATVILNRGVLQVGEYFVAGTSHGKVRAIIDSTGKKLETGHVSQPIRISGFDSVPQAGDQFGIVANEREAKNLIQERINKTHNSAQQIVRKTTVHDIFNEHTGSKSVSFVLNATSHGMLEAIAGSIKGITHKHFQTEVIQTRVGSITASDVEMAKTAGAEILGFQVEATPDAKSLIRQYGIKCTTHQIIYKAIEYVVDLLKQIALQEEMSTVSAEAEVIKVFDVKNVGCVIGCRIVSGSVEIGDISAVHRKGREIYRGAVNSIHRETDKVKIAEEAGEYGIIIKSGAGNIYKNVSVGDALKFYKPVVA